MNQGSNLHPDSHKPTVTNPKFEETYNTWHRPLQGHKNGSMEGLGTTKKKTARETVMMKTDESLKQMHVGKARDGAPREKKGDAS